jgi:membrane-associated phospholipid phosphatase
MSLRTLVVLAAISGLGCVVLAFLRPDGGWEWIPAISGFAIFGVLAGRRISRVPYHSPGLAIGVALILPGYHFISMINRGRPLNAPALSIDRAIEAEPAWMIVYGSVFLFAFLPVFVVRGAELTRRVLWSYIAVELLAFAGFLLYPTALPRPTFVESGFFAWTLQGIYDVDPPRNCFPSLHVAWAFVAASSCYRVHRGVGVAAMAWATLIGISTLFTKQHYFVDVIGGVVIAGAAYAFLLRGHNRANVPAEAVRLAPRRALYAVGIYVAIVAVVGLAYRISLASGMPTR